jgi:cell wall assembly regulator SMI1
MIDRARWETLLRQWSQEILVADEYAGECSPELIAQGWLGYAGATEAQIRQAETRLGATLPPSYREFLHVTNGWRMTTSFIDRLWSTDEIAWFAERNQYWIDAYVAPRSLLGVPSVPDEEGDSAIYLLNPQVVTSDGEWEAWFFANWLPGARRYRSFWELMQAEHEVFLRLL